MNFVQSLGLKTQLFIDTSKLCNTAIDRSLPFYCHCSQWSAYVMMIIVIPLLALNSRWHFNTQTHTLSHWWCTNWVNNMVANALGHCDARSAVMAFIVWNDIFVYLTANINDLRQLNMKEYSNVQTYIYISIYFLKKNPLEYAKGVHLSRIALERILKRWVLCACRHRHIPYVLNYRWIPFVIFVHMDWIFVPVFRVYLSSPPPINAKQPCHSNTENWSIMGTPWLQQMQNIDSMVSLSTIAVICSLPLNTEMLPWPLNTFLSLVLNPSYYY